MIIIRVKEGEKVDRALKRYKKRFEKTVYKKAGSNTGNSTTNNNHGDTSVKPMSQYRFKLKRVKTGDKPTMNSTLNILETALIRKKVS